MDVWFRTGVWMNQGINIYQPPDHLGYPPLWGLWCLIAYRLFLLSNSIEIWRLVVKLPLIISHLALAVVAGEFVANEFGNKVGHKIFYVVLTWSYFIYIGALWGQINTLSALLTFLAFAALVNNRTEKSGLFLGTAVALKIYPLVAFPAFLAYLLRQRSRKEAGMFSLYVFSVPIFLTLFIFAIFQWDIVFFLKTIFYWTPAFESNQVQVQGGGMNLWSFFSLLGLDVSSIWILRLLWIPVLAICSFYWFKKPRLEKADLNLSLITFYLLFMMSYGWVTEQSFIDPLPFIFLQILVYRPKRSHLYLLASVQVLVYAFSAFNYGELIFQPLLENFYPSLLESIQFLMPTYSYFTWQIRGVIGLIVSLSLGTFLIILMKARAPKKDSQSLPYNSVTIDP